jgi:hypothetical protein
MIQKGNIYNINQEYKNWFLGAFVEKDLFNTKGARDFEAKWSKREKGYVHPPKEKVIEDETCNSMVICMSGSFSYSFIQEDGTYKEYPLKDVGDFVRWSPDINHKVEALENSLILTIRWYK